MFLKCFYEQCIEPLQPCDICKLAGAEAINSIWLLSKCYAKNHKQVPYELLQRQVFGNPVTLLNKCDQDTRAAPPTWHHSLKIAALARNLDEELLRADKQHLLWTTKCKIDCFKNNGWGLQIVPGALLQRTDSGPAPHSSDPPFVQEHVTDHLAQAIAPKTGLKESV